MGGRTRRGHKVHHERIKDEIEMGRRPRPERRAPFKDKPPGFGMIARDSTVRTMVVPDATGETLRPIITNMIDLRNAQLTTDGHPVYRQIKDYLAHQVINHEVEYVRGSVHTQNIENYWSILKRGLDGVFHHVGDGYLPMYLGEFESGSIGGRSPMPRCSPPCWLRLAVASVVLPHPSASESSR